MTQRPSGRGRSRISSVLVATATLATLLGDGDLIGGMGYFEASRNKLMLFVDAIGSVVRTEQELSIGEADLKADFAAVEFGAGYRVFETPSGGIFIDAQVGGRYNYLFNSIDVDAGPAERGPQRSASVDFVDPFVGGRWSVRLIDDLALFFRGDIGGFGAGSELAWSLLSGFRYDTSWTLGGGRISALAGYKVYDFDYESGSGRGRRAIAEEFRGPAFGLGATF
jgi:hypothetical protein